MSLPLDPDGFISRQCPTCEGTFKWFHGETDVRPQDFVEPDSYWCPRCGEPADPNSFYTVEQAEYINQVSLQALAPELSQILGDALNSAGRNSPITFEQSGVEDLGQEIPSALVEEATNTIIVASPCHSFEPVKISADWAGDIHCLMCGDAFSI